MANGTGYGFPGGLSQVCAHCSWYTGPFLHADLIKNCNILWLLLCNTDFKLSTVVYIEFCRLAESSRTLKCSLQSRSFVSLIVWMWSLLRWKLRFILNTLTGGRRCFTFIPSFVQIRRPVSFTEKQPQTTYPEFLFCSSRLFSHCCPNHL